MIDTRQSTELSFPSKYHIFNGAYASLGIKVLSYLMIQQASRSTRLTFHQIKLQLSGERQMLSIISAHFHEQNP